MTCRKSIKRRLPIREGLLFITEWCFGTIGDNGICVRCGGTYGRRDRPAKEMVK